MRVLKSKLVVLLGAAIILTACGSGAAPSSTAAPTIAAVPSVAQQTESPDAPPASGLLSGIETIAAGSGYTCALTESGGVKCWGTNDQGQLGNGSPDDYASAPVDVAGLTSEVTAVDALYRHTCALMSGGGVKCWGNNDRGQLGNGSMPRSSVPVDVVDLTSGATGIAVGALHTCALMNDGGVKCWGNNGQGQLGNGSTTDSSVPVEVADLTDEVSALAVGGLHTCALLNGGGVKCWGGNGSGSLGNGSTTDSLTPVDVVGLTSGVTAIAAGEQYTCALTSGDGVKCWGYILNAPTSIPVDVATLTGGVTAISAGIQHPCALMSAGGVKCWGDPSVAPIDVPGLTDGISAIASNTWEAGYIHVCALMSSGGVRCFGASNSQGQLGNGSTTESETPVDVVAGDVAQGPSPSAAAAGDAASAVAAGSDYACALTGEGGVKCWGSNYQGRLGNGSTTDSEVPVDVFGLTGSISAIAAGATHACALTDGGGVKCWGSNPVGQLGIGSTANSLIPVDVTALTSGVDAIAAGGLDTCALMTGGGVKCWGSRANSLIPVDVAGLTGGVTAIAVGGSQTCAVTSGGGVTCWDRRGTPTDVPGLTSGVIAIAAGADHTCAVTSEGDVKCWGRNNYGQLGGESAATIATPVDVVGLTDEVTAITAGPRHTCAITSEGGVTCWGKGGGGQLGNGTLADSATPVDVVGLTDEVTAIATGAGGNDDFTCAVTSAGDVKCWGEDYGSTPADVTGP